MSVTVGHLIAGFLFFCPYLQGDRTLLCVPFKELSDAAAFPSIVHIEPITCLRYIPPRSNCKITDVKSLSSLHENYDAVILIHPTGCRVDHQEDHG